MWSTTLSLWTLNCVIPHFHIADDYYCNKAEWTLLKGAFLVFVPVVAANEFAKNTIKVWKYSAISCLMWNMYKCMCLVHLSFKVSSEVTVTVKLVSEGSGATWQHNFALNGMFIIDGEIVTVSYFRGMNILVYNIITKQHTFQVCDPELHRENIGNDSFCVTLIQIPSIS